MTEPFQSDRSLRRTSRARMLQQRERNQDSDTDKDPVDERTQRTQATAPALVLQRFHGACLPKWNVVRKRPFAFDESTRHITRDRLHHLGHFIAFGQYRATVARILHEPVLPLVAPHLDMGD